jgi:hypothetical protein
MREMRRQARPTEHTDHSKIWSRPGSAASATRRRFNMIVDKTTQV